MPSRRQDLELPPVPGNPEADAGDDGAARALRPCVAGPGTPVLPAAARAACSAPLSPGCELCARGARRGARACAAPSRCCLTVSMATQRVRAMSRGEKMKLKSLLLRYYPPGTGRDSSALAWDPGLWHWAGLGWKRVRGPERAAGSLWGGPSGGDPYGTGSRAPPGMGCSVFQLLDSVPQNF